MIVLRSLAGLSPDVVSELQVWLPGSSGNFMDRRTVRSILGTAVQKSAMSLHRYRAAYEGKICECELLQQMYQRLACLAAALCVLR